MGLEKRIQAALSTEKALTKNQLWDCFTNVSQEQLDTVIAQIAQSGLSIYPESPQERFRRLTQALEKSQSA